MAVILNLALRRNVSVKVCRICGFNMDPKVGHPECSVQRKHEQKYEELILETYPGPISAKAIRYAEKYLKKNTK